MNTWKATPSSCPLSAGRQSAFPQVLKVALDQATKQRFLTLRERSGLSVGQLLREALNLVEKDVDTPRTLGRAEGLAAGKKLGHAEGRKAGEAAGHKLGYAEGHRVGYAEGLKAGRTQATATYRLTFDCSVCGRPTSVPRESAAAKVVATMFTKSGWGHPECLQRSRSDADSRVR